MSWDGREGGGGSRGITDDVLKCAGRMSRGERHSIFFQLCITFPQGESLAVLLM